MPKLNVASLGCKSTNKRPYNLIVPILFVENIFLRVDFYANLVGVFKKQPQDCCYMKIIDYLCSRKTDKAP